MAMDTVNAPQLVEHLRKSVPYSPNDIKWIRSSARFVSVGISAHAKGVINVHDLLSKGDSITTLEVTSGVKCCTFGGSSFQCHHLAYGDYSGTLAICDLERGNSKEPLFSIQNAHGGIINAIDGIGGTHIGYGAPELVTGGRDGFVHVWDPRVSHSVFSLEPDKVQAARDCWTVTFGNSFNDDERCICVGFDNGDVKIYDLRTGKLKWETNVGNGITCIEFDRKDIEMNKMVVTSLESRFRYYDLRTQHATDGFAFRSELAHRSTIWIVRHLPQNRDVFMTGGGNGGLNIYKYHYPLKRMDKHKVDNAPIGVPGSVEILNSRVISTQPINSFDWHPDRAGLCCMSSLDQTLRVYTVTKLDKY